MFSRFVLTVFLAMISHCSNAQLLKIPAPGRAVPINDYLSFRVVGNYPSNLAAYDACVQMMKQMQTTQSQVDYVCSKSTGSKPDSDDSWIQFDGGYYSIPLSGGRAENYYISIFHCPNSDTVHYFPDDNKCDRVTKLPPAPSPKDNGKSCGQPSCGNPIVMGHGGKVQTETDFNDEGPSGLSIVRTYNGGLYGIVDDLTGDFGAQWGFIANNRLILRSAIPQYACYRRLSNSQIYCYLTVAPSGPTTISAVRPDGKILNFTKNDSGRWVPDADVSEALYVEYAVDGVTALEWSLTTPSGVREHYDKDGRFLSVERRHGGALRYTYSDGTTNNTSVSRMPVTAPVCNNVQGGDVVSAGRVLCITDDWGRQLNLEYDVKGRVSKILTPNGEAYLYSYDGASAGCSTYSVSNRACSANNLTSVTFPDGRRKTYHYNERGLINNGSTCNGLETAGTGYVKFLNTLTGITDANSVRYASWSYDCSRQATSSQHAGGVGKVNISYADRTADGSQNITVTSIGGTAAAPVSFSRIYHYKLILGVAKNDSVDRHCDGCGDFAARTYDSRGNVLTSKDWNGKLTQFTYEAARNLEVNRVEALGTPDARTITTVWHTSFPLPLQIWEPKRLTTYSYDDAGRQLTRSEQATTDATGSSGASATTSGPPRVWTYSYNTSGQLLSVTGPRKDVLDVTLYTYDSLGNLETVTDALGHVTNYSNYDRNGRVGYIVAPNGQATDIVYNARGWVTSQTVGGATVSETTTFDYDGVGQLTKVTLPDGSYLSYAYDSAHRLTAVTDSAGNRIAYTLDNMGNRISEQVTNANGALTRQISRVFDALNNLIQITGAAQ